MALLKVSGYPLHLLIGPQQNSIVARHCIMHGVQNTGDVLQRAYVVVPVSEQDPAITFGLDGMAT